MIHTRNRIIVVPRNISVDHALENKTKEPFTILPLDQLPCHLDAQPLFPSSKTVIFSRNSKGMLFVTTISCLSRCEWFPGLTDSHSEPQHKFGRLEFTTMGMRRLGCVTYNNSKFRVHIYPELGWRVLSWSWSSLPSLGRHKRHFIGELTFMLEENMSHKETQVSWRVAYISSGWLRSMLLNPCHYS